MKKTKVSLLTHKKRVIANKNERLDYIRTLSPQLRGAVFEILPPSIQTEILNNLSLGELTVLLDHLDLQKAENMLVRIKNKRVRKQVTKRLKGELNDKLEEFLSFHPKAEITLINFNYLLLSEETTIKTASEEIDEHYQELGRLPEVLIHRNGECIGEVAPSTLIRERNNAKLQRFVKPIASLSYHAGLEKIVNLAQKLQTGKIVLLDSDGSILGIIYADDILKLLDSSPAASLYDFAGVADTERIHDSIWQKVKHRYIWLIINLGTGFLAAAVVGMFQDTLNQYVLLAIYMPIVAGMGGNAATQTLAVIVRGITLGEIKLKNSLRPILNEVGAGSINGIIAGALVALIATFWNQSPVLGFVLAVAMIANLIIASFFGALIPLIMKALGKDPATSATIFITTATDVFGFFAFLGLASLLLV